MFDLSNVRTAANANACEVLRFGYFANDIASLRQSVQNHKTSMRAVYDKLEGICEDRFERRFICSCGSFALFYPMDKVLNEQRY